MKEPAKSLIRALRPPWPKRTQHGGRGDSLRDLYESSIDSENRQRSIAEFAAREKQIPRCARNDTQQAIALEPMTKPLVIAIDGPAGAGKSTVAQMLARRLQLDYVDSGATYRAAALKVIESGVAPEDEDGIARVVAAAEIRFVPGRPQPRVFLDGRDITAEIRTREVTAAASRVSRLPAVRRKLIALQRSLLKAPGVVMEGRDIGTVVFPEAPLKIFLKADPEERARRRVQQNQEQGHASSLKDTLSAISNRDHLDAERKASPLVPAADASVLDSTFLSAEEVVEQILELARKKKLPGPR